MFTGIVAASGRIAALEDAEGLRRLRIEVVREAEDSEGFLADASTGDSIAVDGACLTVVALEATAFEVELIVSTLSRTIAAGYAVGTIVNLERAARLGSRLDGHIVQGHVDGVGELLSEREEGGTWFLDVRLPTEVWDLTILHGSITLNGVSLTVNALDAPDRCQVAIIPHTREVTNLGRLVPGARLNVEGDMIGKYVRKLVRPEASASSEE